jgi:hypothetical protein
MSYSSLPAPLQRDVLLVELKAALSQSFSLDETERGLIAHTHCLYPSCIQVSVRISSREDGSLLVTDDARGLAEILSAGIESRRPGFYLASEARAYGVEYGRGAVRSIIKSSDNICGIIMLVANASKDGVVKTMMVHEISDKPTFDYTFGRFVRENYANKFKTGIISGASGMQRKFKYIHQRGNDLAVVIDRPTVLVEPLSPGMMSISLKTAIHRDIANNNLSQLWQSLVVDRETDNWSNSDISILKQSGVPWMEFPEAEAELQRRVS